VIKDYAIKTKNLLSVDWLITCNKIISQRESQWNSRDRAVGPNVAFAIFFLDWRLKSAAGDFFGA
jgi:hypothetical protein